ncbi:hypothetical protein, partial [Shimia litoralis]|uniref:hypothetical protein n=1 Tax=Shimia litoralis TaxID=420403 RepID=UPI001BB13110
IFPAMYCSADIGAICSERPLSAFCALNVPHAALLTNVVEGLEAAVRRKLHQGRQWAGRNLPGTWTELCFII